MKWPRWLRRIFRPNAFPKCARCGHFDYEHFDFVDRTLQEQLTGCAHIFNDEQDPLVPAGFVDYCLCGRYVPPIELPKARLLGGP